MRKLIAAFAVTLFLGKGITDEHSMANDILSGTWVAFTSEKPDPLDRSLQAMRFRAWLDLCFEYRASVDCTGIKVPEIKRFKPNPFRPGLAGYYQGGDIVYIRKGLKYDVREEVIAHEMSHYLDVMLGLARVPGPARDVCFSEKRAWAVSDAYWIKMGYKPTDKRIVGAKWTEWYRHCTPLQAELYPDVYKN